ncbi:MAG: DegV family protein [Lachnospiraceae bacterium]|nr:DegV family protein [Lachnospiraceae bacterium]
MKVAIITDTNSGMTFEDASNHGIFLQSMPVIIDGKEYREGEDLDDEGFYRMLEDGAVVQTSQPAAGDVIDLWKDILCDYDEIVHIPMSSGLSGTCQSAMLYAQEFDGKVHVVDNKRISVTQRQSALDARAMADNGMSGSEIKAILEETGAQSHIYIMVDTLTYLKKGGRITPAAALIGGVLHLKPVLQIQGDKLDAFSKCRSVKNARKIMTEAVADGIEKEFGGVAYSGTPGAWIGLAHTHNEAAALSYAEDTRAHFKGFDVHVDRLPISIACHIGPGSLALTCTKVLPEGVQY